MNTMDKIVYRFIQACIFLVPLFFLPYTRDVFEYNKHFFLIVFALVLVIAYAVRMLREKRISFAVSQLDMPVLLLAGAYLISLLVSSPNTVYALLQPGGVGTILSLTMIYLLARQFIPDQKQDAGMLGIGSLATPLILSSVVLSLLLVIQVLQIPARMAFLPGFLQARTFTPAGSLYSLMFFLGIGSLLLLLSLARKIGKPQQISILLVGVAAGLIASFYLASQVEFRFIRLPQTVGWRVAIASMSPPRHALFGVGPGNFINAYTAGKPTEMNQTDYWNIRFNMSSNYYFQILTELGIVGLAIVGYLIFSLVKYHGRSPLILGIFIAALFFPLPFLAVFALYVLLAELAMKKTKAFSYPKKHHVPLDALKSAFAEVHGEPPKRELSSLAVAASVVLILLAATSLYFAGRAYAAERAMNQALLSAQTPNHQQTYDLMRQAMQLNPFHPDYRFVFSRTNLALANLIAGQTELTDAQRQSINQLISQSVDNGKLAIQLYPSAGTWENLAGIYAAILPVVEGADAWTIASYNNALTLDPANPMLRIRLGGVYYQLQRYDPAIRQFELAVFLKNDLANSWYNLANAYRQAGKLPEAAFAYQETLKNLDQSTPDYQTAKAEFDSLLAEAQSAQPQRNNLDTLTSPESTPSAQLNNPELEIDEEIPAEDLAPEVAVGDEESVVATSSGDLLLPVDETVTPTPTPLF